MSFNCFEDLEKKYNTLNSKMLVNVLNVCFIIYDIVSMHDAPYNDI